MLNKKDCHFLGFLVVSDDDRQKFRAWNAKRKGQEMFC